MDLGQPSPIMNLISMESPPARISAPGRSHEFPKIPLGGAVRECSSAPTDETFKVLAQRPSTFVDLDEKYHSTIMRENWARTVFQVRHGKPGRHEGGLSHRGLISKLARGRLGASLPSSEEHPFAI